MRMPTATLRYMHDVVDPYRPWPPGVNPDGTIPPVDWDAALSRMLSRLGASDDLPEREETKGPGARSEATAPEG
jgi:hypothetical protein